MGAKKTRRIEKNDCFEILPFGTVFNLRFTDEDEVKCHVQQVHPKEHVNLHLFMCLQIGDGGLWPLEDAMQAAKNFVVPNVENDVFLLHPINFFCAFFFQK